MNPRLMGLAGPFQGTLHLLPEGELTIGRDTANGLYSGDGSLSRRHCVIIRAGDACTVRDLQSRNGTRVNGMPVEEQRLLHGDQLSVGSSVLMFLSEEKSAPFEANRGALDTERLDGSLRHLAQEQETARSLDRIVAKLPGTPELAGYLQSLLKMAAGIGGIRDRESLQWQLLGFLFDVLPAERAAVFYFDKSGEVESSAAWDRARGPEHAVPVSPALLRRIFEEKTGFIPAKADFAVGGPERRPGCALCAPLTISRSVLGAVYLEGGAGSPPYNATHLEVLSAVGSIAALALENLAHWERIQTENQTLRAEVNLENSMVGVGARMKAVFEFVRRVALTDATVLIEGESGTGKELVARAIHRNSKRAENPFVAINCSAIAETLLESELFGHEKGAFTGAYAQKKGKIEMAEGGTLFLDEVGELAPAMQAKLLRVLQEREFERVGATRAVPLDVRLIAATNKKLSAAIEAGEFRKDLYYRLNVVALSMPSLRDRPEDIPHLAEHFLSKAARKCKTRSKALSDQAKACLAKYDWPGNVRELENAIERAVVLGSSDTLEPEDLPETVLESGLPPSEEPANYHRSVKEMKRQVILQALEQAQGSYLEAAKALGIHPNSLLRLMRNLKVRASTEAGPSAVRDARK
jgi:transcriptional regulator with GAF, ATPase, and Fis domain